MTDCVRIPYSKILSLNDKDVLIYKYGNRERKIPPNKWWVNRRTAVGEDAELYERKPYNGKKMLDWDNIIAVEREE